MVELIIAIIVFGAVLAVMTPTLIDLVSTGHRGVSDARADADTQELAAMIASDLARARAPYRSEGVREDLAASVIDDLTAANPQYHDIYWINDNVIAFWADVLSTGDGVADTAPGSEFVMYYLEAPMGYSPTPTIAFPPGPPTGVTASWPTGRICYNSTIRHDWCVIRVVWYRPSTLPGTPWSSQTVEVVTHGMGSLPFQRSFDNTCQPVEGSFTSASTPRMFCYRYVAPQGAPGTYSNGQGWGRTCNSSWSRAGAPLGTLWSDSPFNTVPRKPNAAFWALAAPPPSRIYSIDRIMSVGLTVPGGGTSTKAASLANSVTSMSIRSRMTPPYRQAIMCGSV